MANEMATGDESRINEFKAFYAANGLRPAAKDHNCESAGWRPGAPEARFVKFQCADGLWAHLWVVEA
jgi:hypothetical protein